MNNEQSEASLSLYTLTAGDDLGDRLLGTGPLLELREILRQEEKADPINEGGIWRRWEEPWSGTLVSDGGVTYHIEKAT
jgi:hypothetical protein